jgi:cell wall-associated NlpC family hydrolase
MRCYSRWHAGHDRAVIKVPVKGTYLAISGIGAIFLWSGIKGYTLSQVLRNVISGQKPSAGFNPKNPPNAITGLNLAGGTGNPNAQALSPGSVQGSQNGMTIANDALNYQGHAYQYGGVPGSNGGNSWDCSSFVNWILNHDLMLPIPGYPGGQWNPSTHGPNTTSYLAWGAIHHVSRRNASAGDLCVWLTHMGIAINNSQMISALNPKLGTQVTGIETGGPSGEPLIIMRAALCQTKWISNDSSDSIRCKRQLLRWQDSALSRFWILSCENKQLPQLTIPQLMIPQLTIPQLTTRE